MGSFRYDGVNVSVFRAPGERKGIYAAELESEYMNKELYPIEAKNMKIAESWVKEYIMVKYPPKDKR